MKCFNIVKKFFTLNKINFIGCCNNCRWPVGEFTGRVDPHWKCCTYFRSWCTETDWTHKGNSNLFFTSLKNRFHTKGNQTYFKYIGPARTYKSYQNNIQSNANQFFNLCILCNAFLCRTYPKNGNHCTLKLLMFKTKLMSSKKFRAYQAAQLYQRCLKTLNTNGKRWLVH